MAAAGNYASNAAAITPASASESLTVGALELIAPEVPHEITTFSNYGRYVDIFAVGARVLGAVISSYDAYAELSGTSYSDPVLAGVAVQVVGKYPTASPESIRKFILCISEERVVKYGLEQYSNAYLPVAREGKFINFANATCIQHVDPSRET